MVVWRLRMWQFNITTYVSQYTVTPANTICSLDRWWMMVMADCHRKASDCYLTQSVRQLIRWMETRWFKCIMRNKYKQTWEVVRKTVCFIIYSMNYIRYIMSYIRHSMSYIRDSMSYIRHSMSYIRDGMSCI